MLRALCSLLVPLALAAPVAAAPGDGSGAGEPAAAQPDPAASAALVAAVALDVLPPGIRPAAERRSLAWTHTGVGSSEIAHVKEVIQGAVAGDSEWLEVEYTVDPVLDERVRGVLEGGGVSLGHVILMDPATGEVFSYVSTSPEVFPANRAYPTASLMKVVTAAAVLRNRPEAASRDCRYEGRPNTDLELADLRPPARGGWVDPFRRALAISNNHCFARLAVHDLGEDALLSEIVELGLLEPPAARHPPGRVEPVGDALALGNLGSGLGGSYITPLGAARLAAALAEGELVRPYWIARVRDARGDPLALPERPAPRPVWPGGIASELRELMVDVTARGTARRAFRDEDGEPLLGPIRVSGKTGTLSGTNPTGRYQWFIGVAPAAQPSVAITTVVVENGPEASSAAEVAAATLREVFCDGERCRVAHAARLHARARARDLEAERALQLEQRELTALDRPPRPVGASRLELPRRLLRRKVSGEIVLLLDLNRAGEVRAVRIDSSNLPDFDEVVLEQVRTWKFTPPTQKGRPVEARARLPIPIDIH